MSQGNSVKENETAATIEERYELKHKKSPVFYPFYERKPELKHQTHYCPGCGHGIVHKLIAEALEDLGVQDKTIFVSPVGCSVFAYYYFDVGNVQAAHGRASAVATAVKRACPESIVVSYQGDGDLAAIGSAEIIHAANRGEKFTVIFVNNAIYGMTGGQMAPTTLLRQKSTTTPWGRRPANEGYPLHMCELLATLEAPVYIERVALADNKNIMKARRAVRKALELQRTGAGFSFVEVLSPCPTIWGKDPVEARKWVAEQMIPVYPLKVFRDATPAPQMDNPPAQRPVLEVLEIEPRGRQELSAGPQREHPFRRLTLKIAGFGGQGALLLGQLLTEIGMRESLEVSWLPSYGPEMRSGSAHCHVCLSKERIGSPLISHPDVLIAMNEISLRKFAPQVPPQGLIFYDGDMLPENLAALDAKVICIPARQIADNLGAAKAANMVLLGALLEQTKCLSAEVALAAMESKMRQTDLAEINRKALLAGREFIAGRSSVAHATSDNLA